MHGPFGGAFLIPRPLAVVGYFAEAAQRNPRYAEAWFGVGFCNGWLGRYAYVVAALQQAIHLKPDDAGAHYGLGRAYLLLGDRVSALEQYKILQTLDQNLADALFRVIHQ